MSVNGISGAASQATMEQDASMLVMKKQQDVQKDQAAALVDLVKSAPAPQGDTGRLVNVYA